MTIDLNLPSNEIIHFSGDSVLMTERNQIPGLNTNSFFFNKSPFVKRSQRRYDLAEIMNT